MLHFIFDVINFIFFLHKPPHNLIITKLNQYVTKLLITYIDFLIASE